jgi:4-amino-4-deoxy-L-arabinose transferase-like glycosyltransferase
MKYIRLKALLLKREILINCILVVALICYYLSFLNRGIVEGDEGYYLHNAERILQGQIPYRDFFLQYPPGYFYLLAIGFKLFGTSVLVGKIITLIICLGIFIASLTLLRLFNIYSVKIKMLALFSIAAFGYPLINIPVVVWPSVLITDLIMIQLVKLFQANNLKNIISIGLLLGLQLLIKQNIAISEIIIVNVLMLFAIRQGILKKTQDIFFMNLIWLVLTVPWLYYFILRDNIPALFEFISFNKRYLDIYPFTYPPLSFLLQPLGFLKLLPYYLPIVFFILLIGFILSKYTDRKQLILLLPIVGFFTNIFPTSDLLHVYPYFGLVLVAFLIFISSQMLRFQRGFYLLVIMCIVSGLYLTLFREYYRGQPPYSQQNTPLQTPKAKGILIDSATAQEINSIYTFIHNHTKAYDDIFVYSFSPMLYFLLDRQNPSRYSIYYQKYLTPDEEKATIYDIKKKKVKYIITDWQSDFGDATPLSAWIAKKKKIQQYVQFSIIDAQK